MSDNMDSTSTNPPQDQIEDLSEFIKHLEDYDPAIPDVVVQHYLNLRSDDKRVVRLIALAAQKFIADIVSDSLQHCKLGEKKKDKRHVLTKEHLSAALAHHGISIRRPDYFN